MSRKVEQPKSKPKQPTIKRGKISDLKPDNSNANLHTPFGYSIHEQSITSLGLGRGVVADKNLKLIGGNQTTEIAVGAGLEDAIFVHTNGNQLVVTVRDDLDLDSDPRARELAYADNRVSEVSLAWNVDQIVADLETGVNLSQFWGGDDQLDQYIKNLQYTAGQLDPPDVGADSITPATPGAARVTLAERFIVPPFSVLDARQGYWQSRKQAWIGLGIQSEIGRGNDNLGMTHPETTSTIDFYAQKRKLEAGLGRELSKDEAAEMLAERGQLKDDRETQRQRMANGKTAARTFGQDLMRGEHIVGENGKEKAATYGAVGRGDLSSRRIVDPGGKPPKSVNTQDWVKKTKGEDFTGLGANQSGTSIFDPVLTELAYRWFSPPAGLILDPFAGGSVRGIVASLLNRRYIGIDLRAEQVAANERQAAEICAEHDLPPDNTPDLTPVERRADLWVKRDDLYSVGGVRGGKVRTCYELAKGATGLTTAGSRSSPQVNIVAHIARKLGIPARVHTPTGELSPELAAAVEAGAELIQHNAGYNNVIIARSREDALEHGYTDIPFGMECQKAVDLTRAQLANIPNDVHQIVVPIGSGMSLAGILWGLLDHNLKTPVIGVMVGADPTARLDKFAPDNWREMVTLVSAVLPYSEPAENCDLDGIALDPYYEAKCKPFLGPDDLLWIVGCRQTISDPGVTVSAAAPRWIVGNSLNVESLAPGEYDFIFSCPPYFDLEIYSDDPEDLSNAGAYDAFVQQYNAIIAASVAMLKPDRFACFVVGDIRDKRGMYRNFVSDTIAAFEAAGAELYNEAILVTQLGSLPIRVGKQFESGRKLGKTHQNVLVFVKGDPRKATAACGEVEVYVPEGLAGEAGPAGEFDLAAL
jgi:DNA modification methylase